MFVWSPSCGSSSPRISLVDLSGSKWFGCNNFPDWCQKKMMETKRILPTNETLKTSIFLFLSTGWRLLFCTLSKAPRDSSDESSGITASVCSGTDMQQNTRKNHRVPKRLMTQNTFPISWVCSIWRKVRFPQSALRTGYPSFWTKATHATLSRH